MYQWDRLNRGEGFTNYIKLSGNNKSIDTFLNSISSELKIHKELNKIFDFLLQHPNTSGNTLLHRAVLYCASLDEFKALFSQMDKELIASMAKTLNNDGISVLELVASSKLALEQQKSLYYWLFD